MNFDYMNKLDMPYLIHSHRSNFPRAVSTYIQEFGTRVTIRKCNRIKIRSVDKREHLLIQNDFIIDNCDKSLFSKQ